MRAWLEKDDEGRARHHLHNFLTLARPPTKLNANKLPRVYEIALVDDETITFKIERHHAQRWGAVQTWSVHVASARLTLSEELPAAGDRTRN